MERKTIKSYLIIFTAVITVFFSLFSCEKTQNTPADNSETGKELIKLIKTARVTPGEAVNEKLKEKQSVFFYQDNKYRADSIELVKALIPVLLNSGINSFYVFFIPPGASYNGSEDPEEFLKKTNPVFGYKEYIDFLYYIQNFNSDSASAEETAVILKGIPADPALIKEPSFIWSDKQNLPGGKTENYLSLRHHGPGINGYRWNELIENAAKQLDLRDRTYALYTEENQFINWKEEKINQDIYIVTAYTYKAVTPEKGFIDRDSAEKALAFFPEIKIRKPLFAASAVINSKIKKPAEKYRRFLDQLTE